MINRLIQAALKVFFVRRDPASYPSGPSADCNICHGTGWFQDAEELRRSVGGDYHATACPRCKGQRADGRDSCSVWMAQTSLKLQLGNYLQNAGCADCGTSHNLLFQRDDGVVFTVNNIASSDDLYVSIRPQLVASTVRCKACSLAQGKGDRRWRGGAVVSA